MYQIWHKRSDDESFLYTISISLHLISFIISYFDWSHQNSSPCWPLCLPPSPVKPTELRLPGLLTVSLPPHSDLRCKHKRPHIRSWQPSSFFSVHVNKNTVPSFICQQCLLQTTWNLKTYLADLMPAVIISFLGWTFWAALAVTWSQVSGTSGRITLENRARISYSCERLVCRGDKQKPRLSENCQVEVFFFINVRK